jgi:hypothetical protein
VTLVVYVLLVAAGVVAWGLLSSRFPRLGFVTNGTALTYVLLSPLVKVGFGWTVLGFLTVGFGLFAAVGGLLAQRQRAADNAELPRAWIRN